MDLQNYNHIKTDKKIAFCLNKTLNVLSMNKTCSEKFMQGCIIGQNYLDYCTKYYKEPLLTTFPDEEFSFLTRSLDGSPYKFEIIQCTDSIIIVGVNSKQKYELHKYLKTKIERITDPAMLESGSTEHLVQILLNFYESLLFHMPSNVYWLDKNCITLGCNKNVLDFVGLETLEDFIGIPYEKMGEKSGWLPEIIQSFKSDDMYVLKTGEPILSKEEYPIKSKNGKTAYYISNRVPLKSNNETFAVMGISVDITELKESQKKLEKLANDRKKMLARLTQFVDDQEHDIRTPLGGVAGGLDFIIPTVKSDPDEAVSFLEMIHQSANEILDYQESLLHDLYEGEREGKTIFSRFNIADIASRVFRANEAAARKKDLTYTLIYDDSVPTYLLGDGKRVYQCLLDLLGNAIRFTSSGTVQLSVEYLGEPNNEGIVRFSVSDTGRGIPIEKQRDILKAYVKIDPSNKGGERGRGLGLTRVCQYAYQVSGELRIDSELGQGSCFKLVLPFKISLDQTDSN